MCALPEAILNELASVRSKRAEHVVEWLAIMGHTLTLQEWRKHGKNGHGVVS